MNCQSCQAEIDYRFLTNCAVCNCAVEPLAPVQPEPITVSQPIDVGPKRLNWTKRLLNLVHLFIAATSGMLFGTVVIFFPAVGLLMVVFKLINWSPGCGTGSALGFVLLVLGAFLGTVGGSFYSARHPLYKRPGL